MQVIEVCKNCQSYAEGLREAEKKAALIKTLEEQRSAIENIVERVFFKTRIGINSASIVLESAQEMQSLLASFTQAPKFPPNFLDI